MGKLALSVAEAAECIGVSKYKMYDMIHNKKYKVPYARIDKRIVISRSLFEKWFEEYVKEQIEEREG